MSELNKLAPNSTKPTVAIIGAGPAGLMVADYLRHFDVTIQVFEQKPSPARKLLMAGKSGLNISHAEPLETFISRYQPNDWLAPYIQNFNAKHIQDFMTKLGIASFVGSTGRIFPTMMKASTLLRAWLKYLQKDGVQFLCNHSCTDIKDNQATFSVKGLIKNSETKRQFTQQFDAIVLATGAMSWSRLGSDGKWQAWLSNDEITPFYPSNVGICRPLSNLWSAHLSNDFGKALKRVKASLQLPSGKIESGFGDIIISHYGMESGLIYRLNSAMREQLKQTSKMSLTLDLLPDIATDKLLKNLNNPKKQSLSNLWRKAGLDPVKIALLREIVPKPDWHNSNKMANFIKNLTIEFDSFRPIEEAISCGGGVKRSALTDDFQLKSNPYIFCCGEMLDWDAPTGGYLLTACFATGQAVGKGVVNYLELARQ